MSESHLVPADEVLVQALAEQYLEQLQVGQRADRQALLAAHPEIADRLAPRLALVDMMFRLAQQRNGASAPQAAAPGEQALRITCPHCGNGIQLVTLQLQEVTCLNCGSSFQVDARPTGPYRAAELPERIGKFEVLEQLGRGAFGAVYKCLDPELQRTVAVKMPRAGAFDSPEEQERFLREARSAAQLQHPSIVQVHEVGQEKGLPYIVSDYVEGLTLSDLLSGGRPSHREAAELVAALADALAYAHQARVVHRDIKPSNILIDRQGRPHLTDFGLARRDEGEVTVTLEGQVLGTPAYMSPEQAAGEAHQVDARSDVYSLGVVLYELLTGELPFRGNKRMLLHQVLHDEPRAPRSLNDRIPRDLETICLKTMAKEPPRRYPSAAALAADLRRWLTGEPIHARPAGRIERLAKWARRRPAAALLLVVGLLTAIGLPSALVWLAMNQKAHGELRAAADREARLRQVAESATDLETEARKDAEAAHAEAEKRRQQAVQAREGEERERKRTERLLNGIRVTQAHHAWRDGDVNLALDLLNRCPLGSRFWDWHHVKHLTEGGQMTLSGHTGPVVFLRFSPDGLVLASGSQYRMVRLWETSTGRELHVLRTEKEVIRSVALSPDGQRLVIGAENGTVHVWDPSRGEELQPLMKIQRPVTALEFSPDGQCLAVVAMDGFVRVLDFTGARELLTLKLHPQAGEKNTPLITDVKTVAFSPDGRYLAAGCLASFIKVWDAHRGQELMALKGRGAVTSLCYSPDGQLLASALENGTIQLWDAQDGRELHTLTGPGPAVHGVAFSPEGRRLASASIDRMVRIWDVNSGRELHAFKGHTGGAIRVCFSPDGQRLAVGLADGIVKIWDVRGDPSALVIRAHPLGIGGVAFTPDHQRIVSAGSRGQVKVWDARTGHQELSLPEIGGSSGTLAVSPDGRQIATASSLVKDPVVVVRDAQSGQVMHTFKGHTSSIQGLAFSPRGRLLASASYDKTIRIWDVDQGKEHLVITTDTFKGAVSGAHRNVCFSPDGQCVAGLAELASFRVNVWKVDNGQVVQSLRGHTSSVRCVAFSPDGQRLATGGMDRIVKVWDLTSGQEVHNLRGHNGDVTGVSFSPDGQRLASSSFDGTVKLWDLETGLELLTLRGHSSYVTGVSFRSDGRQLASIGIDGSLRLWEAPAREPMLLLHNHTAPVQRVCFSPDSKRLASAASDKTARIWDVKTGQELHLLKGHQDVVTFACFSPDGQQLATASRDRTVRIWDAQSGTERFALRLSGVQAPGVLFSPDGRRLVTTNLVDGDKGKLPLGEVKIWDASNGQLLLTLAQDEEYAYRVAFSPDGQLLAGLCPNHVIRVWDSHSGRQLFLRQAHIRFIFDVCFSPDGKRLASSSLDRTVKVWDIKEGNEPVQLQGPAWPWQKVQFSPDGRKIIGSSGSSVFAWDASSGKPVALGPEEFRSRVWEAQSPDGKLGAQIYHTTIRVFQCAEEEEEIAYRQKVARLDLTWHAWEAERHEKAEQWFAAAFHLGQILSASPGDLKLYCRLATALGKVPDLLGGRRLELALACLGANNVDDYRRICNQLLDESITAQVGAVMLALPSPPLCLLSLPAAVERMPSVSPAGIARACAVRPDAVREPSRLLTLLTDRDDPVTRAAVFYRTGKLHESLKLLADQKTSAALLYRALAEHALGRTDAAKAHWEQAQRWLETPSEGDPGRTNATTLTWPQRLEVNQLLHEVEALLKGRKPRPRMGYRHE